MNGKLKSRSLKKYAVIKRLTMILFTMITADAAYILSVVQKMNEDIGYAMENYYAVPLMTEHILAAVVVYLVCMVFIYKISKSEKSSG